MSLFKGHKIDYDQAEAEVKLAETDERRKEARAECYKAIRKKLDKELLPIKKKYPNCVAEEITSSTDFSDIDKDCFFTFSHTEKFNGYAINTYLVTNEVNYSRDCYEDNYHKKLEWSYGLSETLEVSFVIFKSEESRKNYFDIGKYVKLKKFSESEFVEHAELLKNESEESLKRDKDNIEAAKKLYATNKGKNIFFNVVNSAFLLASMFFFILACVSVFLICYGGERNSFFLWFTSIPFYCYIVIWGADILCILLCVKAFRHSYKRYNGGAVATYLALTAVASALMTVILLKYDYFTGDDRSALKWLKLLAYISAISDIVSSILALRPVRLAAGSTTEKCLEVREVKYRKAVKYMQDPTNIKCHDLLAERKDLVISNALLKSETTKIKAQKTAEKERRAQDEINEILKKFDG